MHTNKYMILNNLYTFKTFMIYKTNYNIIVTKTDTSNIH